MFNSLLSSEIYEVGSHAVLLTPPQLVHAERGSHVLVSHLVPHPPPHVHHLVLQPVLLPAVLLDLGVDILHQRVPLHQHVGEGGAGEDSHDLKQSDYQLSYFTRDSFSFHNRTGKCLQSFCNNFMLWRKQRLLKCTFKIQSTSVKTVLVKLEFRKSSIVNFIYNLRSQQFLKIQLSDHDPTFELRGGRWSRLPAKILSTVASSLVIVLFIFSDHSTLGSLEKSAF